MNRKHLKSGHLFQGRYKAQLVESELYKNKLSRYIHLNPVKIKGLEELPLEELKSRLEEFKWSSYRYYIGHEKKPEWLERGFVLSSWGKTAKEKISNYRQYVEDGIKSDNTEDTKALLGGSILGSEKFKKEISRKYLDHDVSDIDSREQPVLATVNTFSFDDILKAVAEYYQISDFTRITIRRGCHPEARKMAMFLTGKHCRRNETLTDLGSHFGVKISGFNMACDKFKTSLRNNPSLHEEVANTEGNIKSYKMEV